jgi:alkylation response protein AidB-like acyl-CoA dehydrogenase
MLRSGGSGRKEHAHAAVLLQWARLCFWPGHVEPAHVHLMHQVAEHFEVVIWRSLRDAPACETLLDDCLQVLAPQALRRLGYEGYARLLRRMAESEHQSCLLLTSPEKPSDLVQLEGGRAPVRVLRLTRLAVDACKQLLAQKDVVGSAA